MRFREEHAKRGGERRESRPRLGGLNGTFVLTSQSDSRQNLATFLSVAMLPLNAVEPFMDGVDHGRRGASACPPRTLCRFRTTPESRL